MVPSLLTKTWAPSFLVSGTKGSNFKVSCAACSWQCMSGSLKLQPVNRMLPACPLPRRPGREPVLGAISRWLQTAAGNAGSWHAKPYCTGSSRGRVHLSDWSERRCCLLKAHRPAEQLLAPAAVLSVQVGQQELGLGLRFCARVCLRITEFPGGVPRRMLSRGWSGSAKGGGSASSSSGGGSTAGWWPFVGSGAIPGFPGRGSSSSSSGNPSTSSSNSSSSSSDEEQLFSERRYLRPRSPLGGAPSMDVAFQALEGDFTVFKGLWRVQAAGPAACRLSYSLFVRPQPWLLVGLVEQRIQAEITANLAAVKAQVER